MASILKEMEKQSQDICPENFICSNCKNYKGACACEANVFIAFVGANMSNCRFYQSGRKCPYCGRVE
jgi:hypothetical protein